MARTITRKVTGLDSISKVLKQLPVELRGNILRDAVSAAAEPVKDAAKRHARRSVRTGALYASIDKKVVVARGLSNASATAIVGPSRDYFTKGGKKVAKGQRRSGAEQPSRYAHLIEFGHFIRERGKNGQRTGKKSKKAFSDGAVTWVAPRPFMRPAMISTQSSTLRIMEQSVANGIERARRKLAKGA